MKLSEKCFLDIIKVIHELTGITIATNRISMVEGRLRKRVAALNTSSYEEYLDYVRINADEKKKFISMVTTNETYFFRTPRVWDYIETKFLPQWIATNPKKTIHIWSAAASSGEEAHSLGVVCQFFKEKYPDFNYKITGTDISQNMIVKCKEGKYTGKAIDNFQKIRPALFKKYMQSTSPETYQVIPEIKNHLTFKEHNLFNKFESSEPFDLILARNVLIYFKPMDQEKVLSLISSQLGPSGQLIIGESESLSHISTQFKHIEPLVYSLDASKTVKKAA